MEQSAYLNLFALTKTKRLLDCRSLLVPNDEPLEEDIAGGQSHRANLQRQQRLEDFDQYNNGTSGDVRNIVPKVSNIHNYKQKAQVTTRVPENSRKVSNTNLKYSQAELEGIRRT